MNGDNSGDKWSLTKEKILLFFGLSLVTATWIATEVFSKPLHLEYLIAGLACCGVAIAQWGDKGGRG